MSATAGIYKITNTVNQKVYIGQSVDIDERWKVYKRGNFHGNKHLEADWNIYGSESFVFEVVKECEPHELDMYEHQFITKYDTLNVGYNLQQPRDYSRLNMELIEEYKHRILEAFANNEDGKYWLSDVADSFELNEQELGIVLDGVGCDLFEKYDVYLYVYKNSFSYDNAIIEKTSWAEYQERMKVALKGLRL